MHLALFLTAAICSFTSLVVCQGAQYDEFSISGLNSNQASALSTVQAGFTTGGQFSSYGPVIATATASFDDDGESSALNAAATGGKVIFPSVPTDLPEPVRQYLSSAYNAEISVLSKYRSGNAAAAAPTGALIAAGAAAVGAMGFGAM